VDTTQHASTHTPFFAPQAAATQPPIADTPRLPLTAAIATLALGGAEKIVLDWAAACVGRYRIQLIVLRTAAVEWPVPAGITVTRLTGNDPLRELEALARDIAKQNSAVLCHLLRAQERAALERGGVHAIPVLHNAGQGWSETAATLRHAPRVITVSQAAACELRDARVHAPVTVIRHLPRAPVPAPGARGEWRERWGIPANATVIGMLGAVKPQKDYPRALRLFARLLERRDAWLVIIGGPVGHDGAGAWYALLACAQHLGIEHRLRVPGFIAHAAHCLPAFDLLLNTSAWEGLSIATLEALAAGLPAVVSAVGGQGEVDAPGLTRMDLNAGDGLWCAAIDAALQSAPALPAWLRFPAHRLWTLFHLPPPAAHTRGVLFVTANLNAGGAQRSLVNLACAWYGAVRFEIAVCGDSSSEYFHTRLARHGITVRRTAASRDAFDHAEEILKLLFLQGFSTACLWNVDARVKLLLAKALAHTRVKLVDVSPGAYAFHEMREAAAFQQWIAFDETRYHARLDALVLKYAGEAPAAAHGKTRVIPNGVALPPQRPRRPRQVTRIVVNGRIAPSKFVLEIIDAMHRLWLTHPRVELHVLGSVEPRHAAYGEAVLAAIAGERERRVFLHGAVFDAPERLADYDIALVLGEHQGCPNAVLEALAAGITVAANDSGGTREQIIDGRTGLLLPDTQPQTAARALERLLNDPALAARLAQAGRRHVAKHFSMSRMARAYRKLLV
jgi:glycosyltransferase involved in cell wall biosynthesis